MCYSNMPWEAFDFVETIECLFIMYLSIFLLFLRSDLITTCLLLPEHLQTAFGG